MKLLIQRVSSASVEVSNDIIASIGTGLLLFLGITHADTPREVDWLVRKCCHLRIFSDSEDKMNLSLIDKRAEVLLVSQFTLYGESNSGRRPSFTAAATPERAEPLYKQFINQLMGLGIPTKSGLFGAEMKVSLINDGPVTLLLAREHNEICGGGSASTSPTE